MACEHQNGGLQIPVYQQDGWHSRCIICDADAPVTDPGPSPEAGQAAALGLHCRSQRRYGEAAEAFRKAYDLSGDARYLFASLLCRLGVTWCGNEYQPTFAAASLPMEPLTQTAEWQTIEEAAGSLNARVYQVMQAILTQLEEILGWLRANEGRKGCDVFICYRRSDAAVRHALRLYRDLTDDGLRVFCADVTTNGKTQEQFESEVWFALRTAEFLVLIPGEGEDALSPWLRNELERAACDKAHRMVCTEDCTALPAAIAREGDCLSMEAIRTRLFRAAEGCTADKLFERAAELLQTPGGELAAEGMLRRASSRGSQTARLLLAGLYGEGLTLPEDPARAALYRSLAGSASDAVLQTINSTLNAIDKARSLTHGQALIYLVADVSDTGVKASQTLMRPFISSLYADRRLAGAHLCVVGYDRHAQVLEEPKELGKYGLPDHAVMTLRTSREAGRDRAAYAAKGLRCAASHILQHCSDGQTPFVVLLHPCPTNDAEASIPAALATLEPIFRNTASCEISSFEHLPACITAIRRQL
ncbi:MAG: toll/interleukin-1 receptor domain-containing protein [Clostridia bacterium]|nr:toll/interleukin-1 receptor domain-containing protein [Clostridia bacterium]